MERAAKLRKARFREKALVLGLILESNALQGQHTYEHKVMF